MGLTTVLLRSRNVLRAKVGERFVERVRIYGYIERTRGSRRRERREKEQVVRVFNEAPRPTARFTGVKMLKKVPPTNRLNPPVSRVRLPPHPSQPQACCKMLAMCYRKASRKDLSTRCSLARTHSGLRFERRREHRLRGLGVPRCS